jgi:hypothetical protein
MRSKSIRHGSRFFKSTLQPDLAMILGVAEEKRPELSESSAKRSRVFRAPGASLRIIQMGCTPVQKNLGGVE